MTNNEKSFEHLKLRPFLRWAGSKQKLIPYILPYIPSRINNYFEPFAGSAALLLFLKPSSGVISDKNFEIINAFQQIREHGNYIDDQLIRMKPDREYYYYLRENIPSDNLQRAINFIYMNKVCWNGLYRVNLKGKFNVPYGFPKTDFIIRKGQISNIQSYLAGSDIQFRVSDFADACESAIEGDLVFFDPPYVTTHNNNGFIAYNESIFSWQDQIRLSKLCLNLIARGVHVLVTNAFHSEVVKLFEGMSFSTISRHSTLASKISHRRVVSEALFFSPGMMNVERYRIPDQSRPYPAESGKPSPNIS